MRTTTQHRRRPGFTLVELLVAAGLCILIMTILTYAFQKGMDSVSYMKSVGDLQIRLRAAEIILRDDLAADHLDSDYGPRVSAQRLDLLAAGDPNAWKPPRGGFFRILQESPTTIEGYKAGPPPTWPVDADGLPVTRATDHILHFTVRRPVDRPEKVFKTSVDPAVYPALSPYGLINLRGSTTEFVSPWAEIVYFLDTQNQTGTTPTGLPMYPLVRRVRVMTTGTSGFTWDRTDSTNTNYKTKYPGMSYSPVTATKNLLNGPAEIANPTNRLGGVRSDRTTANGLQSDSVVQKHAGTAIGEDILLTNAVSFEVKATWDGTPGPTGFGTNKDAPYDDLPAAPTTNGNATLKGRRVFDTWWNNANWNSTAEHADKVPQFIRLKSVQVKVRIYDPRNKLARQITLIQDV